MKRRYIVGALVLLSLLAAVAQEKPDALKSYRHGRDLEAVGRMEDAKGAYGEAINICKEDLVVNPRNMDAYTIFGWSLVRMGKYRETVDICQEALKISNDHRIVETMGEAYFYLGNYKESLRNMEKYTDAAPRGERISTAYFFIGETYRITRQYNRADIAYSAAVHLEPAIALWWFRLGTVRETVGDKIGASDAYRRAVKLRPDYQDANEGLKRVRT
ncbi:MAG TPA: tetratricopeptide repeat protein [Treponema sp.]|nr:tetratricopeptide repeat protein [Treponema sp.]